MGIGELFNTILYEPIYNALFFIYGIVGQNMGFAIIILTLLIKLLLLQPSLSQLRSQRSLQEMQPKLKALQAKYKGDKEGYNKAILQFYKENKVNPLSSCLPLLIQLPILIALYRVFIGGVSPHENGLLTADQLNHLYGSLRAIYETTPVRTMFLGLLDLSKSGNLYLALLAGAATYWQSRMIMTKQPPKEAGEGGKDEARMASMSKNMMYLMPIVTIFFSYRFPAGLALYWLVVTLFQVGLQYYFLRWHIKKNDVQTVSTPPTP